MKTQNIILFFLTAFALTGCCGVVRAQEGARSPALIFYEVRGDGQEMGSLQNDIDSVRDSGQPVTFLWSYPKLFDETAISLVRGLNTYQGGVLLEVDDSLRKDAGVTRDTLWPSSIRDVERTTILGYSTSDRRKLVDTLIQQYISAFGQAPQVVSSRIIDTPTANYLKDAFGIRFQIIDEEYKDKDHSMLDGGPSLVPYPASANWLLVPDHTNPDPIWVVRKPSPDFNHSLVGGGVVVPIYVFSNVSFTKDTSAPANLPLYSLSPILASRQSLDLTAVATLYPKDISLISYGSIDVKLYEVTTPTYRIRILRKKSDMWITDIRLYNKSLIDPYTSRIAHYGYYMVVPYLLNETGWKDGDVKYISEPDHITHIKLPDFDNSNAEEALIANAGDHLAYIMQYNSYSQDGRKMVIVFNKDTIQIVGFYKSTQKLPYSVYPHPLNPIVESRDSLSWVSQGEKVFGANLNCKSDTCEITFNTHNVALYNNTSNQQPLFTFPEPELLDSSSKVTLANSSRTAVVGEKVNVSLINQSQSALTVVPSTKATISSSQPITVSPWQRDSIYEPSYFIFTRNAPADVKISLSQDDIALNALVTIVPNCGQNWLTCIKSPKSLFKYLFR